MGEGVYLFKNTTLNHGRRGNTVALFPGSGVARVWRSVALAIPIFARLHVVLSNTKSWLYKKSS